MIAVAKGVAGFLGGIVGDLFADWKAARENKRRVAEAVTNTRIKLAESEQTHNQEWELRALEGRDTFLRRASFVAWTWPLVWAAFDAEGARRFFEVSLAALPDWYVTGYLSVTAAVWGLMELRNMGMFGKRGKA